MPYFSNKFSLDCNDNIVLLTFIGKGEQKLFQPSLCFESESTLCSQK